ncbi:MAG: tetratricopeptide repeat protein, partial [Acaryochloris sp. CRU_2_0]|nr:tetratricopeptide repeat protein [Acaryochloris sp. CRU_2_0]
MLKVFLSGLPWLALCATTALPPRTLAAPSPLPPEPGTRTNSLAQAIPDPEPAQPAQQITVRVLTPTHQGSGTLLGKQGNRYLVLATLANYHQSKTGNIVEVPKGNAAPEIWIQQGNPLRQLGRHPEAIIALQESTRRQPNYTPALGSLAASQREVQQALEALAAINKAIQQQPNNADLYNEKFLILRNLERHQEALAAINQALKRSEQAGFYYNRGLTYNALKQYPQALADYNKAIALNPKDAEAYFNRGLTYFYDLKQYP